MLQQTQVATVIPYYHRFLAAFPDISSLAAAHEDRVLRLWEGLGYYRRARQLHRAAQQIVEAHGGQFPTDFETVRGLPGIGRYTAGAVLSFAFDQRWPILEANTIRVYARLLAERGDPRTSAGQKRLWQAAEDWLPRRRPGRFNQAMMELGSLVCTPRQPRCEECPARALCPTRALGLQDRIPTPARRPVIEDVREAIIVARRAGKVLLLRRGAKERWAGMWDFPRFAMDGAVNGQTDAHLVDRLFAQTGVSIGRPRLLTTLKHGVTRFRITLDCYMAAARSAKLSAAKRLASGGPEMQWVEPARLAEFPLSVTGRKLARLVVQLAAQ